MPPARDVVKRRPPKRRQRSALERARNVSGTVRVGVGVQGRGKVKAQRQDLPARVGRTVAREATGRGEAVKAAQNVKDFIVKNAIVPSTGAGPSVAVRRSVKPKRGGGRIAAATAPSAYRVKDSKIAEGIVRDLVDYPLYAVPAAVEIGRAGVEAAHGDTKRAKQIGKSLTEGFVGNLVRGKPDKALKYLEEHPLFSLTEVAGAGQIAGRSAGAVARATKLGGQTARAELEAGPGVRITDRRRYSKNLIVKQGQKAADRARKGQAGPARIERTIKQRADFTSDQANQVSRLLRADEGKRARAVEPRQGRLRRGPEADVVSLRMEGVIRGPKTIRQDLRAELTRLDREYSNRRQFSASQRKANRRRATQVRKVLDNPKALRNPAGIERSARTLTQRANEFEREAIRLGALTPESAARAKLFPFAQAHMGARREGGRLVAANGAPLPNQVILAEMRRRGVPFEGDQPTVAYLPHRQDVRGPAAYYQTAFTGSRRNLNKQHRTGEAFRKGTYESSYALPTEHLQRMRGVVNRIGEHDRLVREAGVRDETGQLMTWKRAEELADSLADTTGVDWVPYRAVPGKARHDLREMIDELQGGEASPNYSRFLDDDLAGRLRAPSDPNARGAVVVPRQFVDRLREHNRGAGDDFTRGAQAVTSAFRGTVLPFSSKWLTGNVVEMALRLAVRGVAPHDARIGRRVIKALEQLDRNEALRVRASLVGGQFFGQRGLTVHRGANQFTGALKRPAAAMAAAARTPPVRQALTGLRAYQDAVFGLNRAMEQAGQYAVLGKYARREIEEMSGSWAKGLKAQEKAVQDVAKGLLDTKNQVDAARFLDETLGKYSRFSPAMRRAIQTYTPFLPWYANSLRFVMWTLPVKHPVKTAVLQRVEATIKADIQAQNKDAPPGALKQAIRTKDGGYLDLSRYTPFGAFTAPLGGDTETLADPLLPQISGAAAALRGQNFTGRAAQIKGQPYGEVPADMRALMAVNALLEGLVPGVQVARRAREGGGTPYDNSWAWSPKTKPGSDRETAANRILNPLRPTHLKPPKKKAAGKGDLDAELRDALGQDNRATEEQLDRELREALKGLK